jgi:hypothetical protein
VGRSRTTQIGDLMHNDWWASLHRRASSWLAEFPLRLCRGFDRWRIGPLRGGEIAHVVFLNLVLCIPYAVFAQYRHDLAVVLHLLLGSGSPALLDPSLTVRVSRFYPEAHAVFAASCLVPRSFRTAFLVAGTVGLVVATPLGDPFSAVFLAAYLALVLAISRSRNLGLGTKIAVVMVSYLVFNNACQLLEGTALRLGWPFAGTPAIVQIATFAPGFVPMLWYSVQEISTGRMSSRAFGLYLTCRFFTAPVFSPRELRIDGEGLRRWQWRGVGALGSAFLGAILFFALQRRFLDVHHRDWFTSSGARLWGYSLVFYLAFGFRLQATLNMFVGLARLAGVPVENNFYFWALARTPNERWRRWNRLFRDWILTYVFYPMMRAKRGLFLTIMATLLASGLVHLAGALTPQRFDAWSAALGMGYWLINGLAIYSVIVAPKRWPGWVDRLRLRDLAVWSVLGMLATGASFGVLFVARDHTQNLADLVGYFARLADLLPRR